MCRADTSHFQKLSGAKLSCNVSFKERETARNNLTEEISDVLIIIKQLQELYDISDHDIETIIVTAC